MYNDNGDVTSFAEPDDVTTLDQRIFDANESLTESVVLTSVERATDRILGKLKVSQWWRKVNSSSTIGMLPDVDANLILTRHDDFTDLCMYTALANYILPGVADFADEDSSERQKMVYYSQRADELYIELSSNVDWYDTDNDGSISSDEAIATPFVQKRIR